MAEFSYPFDGGAGAIVTEDNWSTMAGLWQDDGVVSDNLLSISLSLDSQSVPNQVILKPGKAFIQGFMYENTEDLILQFSTNNSPDPRRDRVVLRLDRNTNTIQAVIKEGTPSSSPSAPSLNTVYPIHEISLATFPVAAGASTVSSFVISLDRQLIGKRTHISDTPAAYGKGSLVYNPVDDKFYGVGNAGAKELGSSGGGGVPTGGSWELPVSGMVPGDFFYETDTGRLMVFDEFLEEWVPLATAGRTPEIIYKVSDQNFSSTTMQIDNHLQYDVPGPGEYLIEGTVWYWCNSPNSQMTFSVAGPTVLGAPRTRCEYQTNASAEPQLASTNVYPLSVGIGANASNTYYTVHYEMFARFSDNASPLVCRYLPASNSHTWTISAGSWMRVTRLQ